MIPNDHAVILFKFGALKWMDKIRRGSISFSCPGKYIEIAKKTGNDEQGDVNEGVFARLSKGDKKIKEMQAKLNDDLEIIDLWRICNVKKVVLLLHPNILFLFFSDSRYVG